jgi:LysR family transcriptional regulator, regulatory protein for tcuABC
VELRQLSYFVRVVECGSMGRAARELGVVTSALSQQISRLEGELSARLLQRTKSGVRPTNAGLAFCHQAQLTLRHAEDAVRAAQHGRLAGHVSVGLPPSTSGVLGVPFMKAMHERYPDVYLHVVESLSGNLVSMLNARHIDLAVLFGARRASSETVISLLNERLFAISSVASGSLAHSQCLSIKELSKMSLILPSQSHGLRLLIDESFAKANCDLNVVAEVDGLAMLMDAVGAGFGVTVQPGAALARLDAMAFVAVPIKEPELTRINQLVSLSDDELSPVALAARVVLIDVVRTLVHEGQWAGAELIE